MVAWVAVVCQSALTRVASAVGGILVLSLLAAPAVGTEHDRQANVLVIYTDPSFLPAVVKLDGAFRSALRAGASRPIAVHNEFLQTPARAPTGPEPELRAYLRAKYAGWSPDVIVAGSSVLRFVRRLRDELFPQAPIVVVEVAPGVEAVALGPRDAVLRVHLDWRATLEAALRLQPETRHVVVVGGASERDRRWLADGRAALAAYEGRVAVRFLTEASLEEILATVSSLPDGTIVLAASLARDRAGTTFVGREAVEQIAQAARVPAYGLFEHFIGHGIVGGRVLDFGAVGAGIAEVALRVLRGERGAAASAGVSTGTAYVFDWRQLRRWGLREDRLPPGSSVRFRPPSTWQLYRWHILGVIAVATLQAALIGVLLVERAGRRRVQRALDDRLRFEALLSDLSAVCVSAPTADVDRELERTLGQVSEFLGADRATLVELSMDERGLVLRTHAWARPGVEPVPSVVDRAAFPWAARRIAAGGTVRFRRIEELPDVASVDRESYRRLGTKSNVVVPLKIGGAVLGALSFGATRTIVDWPDAVVQRLQLLAEIMANVVSRKRSDAALRASEARYREVVETQPYLICGYRPDLTLTFVNVAFCRWFGRTREALIGLSLLRLIPELGRDVTPRHAGARAPSSSADELEVVLAEGSVRWLQWLEQPVRDANGRVVEFQGIGRDITERRRAQDALHKSHETIMDLAGRLITAQEEERRRLGRDLHDDVSQRLAALAISLSALARRLPEAREPELGLLRDLQRRTRELAEDVRRLSHDLHPAVLEHAGLAATLETCCREFSRTHGIDVRLTTVEGDFTRVPADVALGLYRVAQEALANVVRHSGAKRAEVRLRATDTGVDLQVSDAGKGFDPDEARQGRGLGLISMQERVRLHRGAVEIRTAIDAGTDVMVHIPF